MRKWVRSARMVLFMSKWSKVFTNLYFDWNHLQSLHFGIKYTCTIQIRCLDCFMLHLISGSASNCQNLLRTKAPDFHRKKNCHCNCVIKTFVKNTVRAVFTWLSKGIGFGFGFGFTTLFGWLVYLLWFWFYNSQVKTALKYSNNLNHKGNRALGTGK